MRLLVCGGCGFIGTNFIKIFLELDKRNEVINLDALTYSGVLENHQDTEMKYLGRYQFIYGDIKDEKVLEYIAKYYSPIDAVINFAAETHVDRSIHIGAKEFIYTNIIGVFNLLELVKKFKILKYIQVSTDEVYGKLELDEDRKFKEDDPFHPNVPYSATKAGGDLLCMSYWNTFKVPVIVTHCSNNYGPFQYPEKLIPFFVLRIINNQYLPLYGDGKNVRDWIYVGDHVKALILLLLKGKPGEVYNIGADNERQNIEVAKMILKIMKEKGYKEVPIKFVADRPGHDRRYAIDNTKIKSLGWRPDFTRERFEEGLRYTIDWYLNNKSWIEFIQKKTGVINPHIDLWKKHNIK